MFSVDKNTLSYLRKVFTYSYLTNVIHFILGYTKCVYISVFDNIVIDDVIPWGYRIAN